MLMADDFCLVIAEGSQKSHKKYSRLMLNRIDWNQSQEEEQQGLFLLFLSLVGRSSALLHQDSCAALYFECANTTQIGKVACLVRRWQACGCQWYDACLPLHSRQLPSHKDSHPSIYPPDHHAPTMHPVLQGLKAFRAKIGPL